MDYDIVIRNGSLIDGTGSPARPGDIAVREGRIAAIGEVAGKAREEIDAGGMAVAPGFIDIHTHYDAQLFWDPKASPSSHHGVTTIVCGNCGFSIAPLSGDADDAEYLIAMLSRVEGMSVEALKAGVPWDWTSFGQYLDHFEGKLAVNAGFMVGHSALRRAVMHERAVGEKATRADIAEMEALLSESIAAGGLGLSSTICPIHTDADGQPIPSRWADDEEIYALSAVVGRHEGTVLEFQPNNLGAFDEAEMARMAKMATLADRPLNWNLFVSVAPEYERHNSQLAASDYAAERGGHVSALASVQAMTMRVNLISGFVFDQLPDWGDTMKLPFDERIKALADPDNRKRLAEGVGRQGGLFAAWGKLREWRVDEVFDDANRDLQGLTIGEIADRQGKAPIDAMLDLAVAEGLRTSFQGPPIGDDPESWRLRAESWRDKRTIIGGSDAGAHLDMIDTFAFSSMVLGEGVRNRAILPIEDAIHQMTGLPARHLGLRDRGELREGAHADIVVFDPETIDCGPVRTRTDLPTDAVRLYADAIGMHHVIVNGTSIVRDGRYTEQYPGKVLRSGVDTMTPIL